MSGSNIPERPNNKNPALPAIESTSSGVCWEGVSEILCRKCEAYNNGTLFAEPEQLAIFGHPRYNQQPGEVVLKEQVPLLREGELLLGQLWQFNSKARLLQLRGC